jgi:hypothetical protein
MHPEQMRGRRTPLFLLAVLALALAAAVPASALDVTTMKLGSTFAITGKTGSIQGKHARAIGKVVVSGRWGSGQWHVLTTTATDRAGNYQFSITPHRRGNLTLRIAPPDHHPRRYLLHVY